MATDAALQKLRIREASSRSGNARVNRITMRGSAAGITPFLCRCGLSAILRRAYERQKYPAWNRVESVAKISAFVSPAAVYSD
jgi:hypothetical protein